MESIEIVERDISKGELDRMLAGFQEHQLSYGNVTQQQTRYSFVLLDGGKFVGCISGLRDNNWFYLSDLWLEEPYRKFGFGRRLLTMWEARVAADGVKRAYTWTAGYEAPGFYKKHGWSVFVELPAYYTSGHSRVGLLRNISLSD